MTREHRACVKRRTSSLNAFQTVAAVVFSFNVGCGAFRASTAAKLIDAGLMDSVPDAMSRYNKVRNPKTKVLEVSHGLINRRAREARIWRCEDVKICSMAKGETR